MVALLVSCEVSHQGVHSLDATVEGGALLDTEGLWVFVEDLTARHVNQVDLRD